MPGRRPKPTWLKQLAGNPGHRRLNDAEPKPSPAIPKCPRFLVGAGRRKWKEITRDLFRLGVISQIDQTALAAMCFAYGQFEDAARGATRNPAYFKGKDDMPYMNPDFDKSMKALKELRALMAEFGLTPASRTRVRAPKAEDRANNSFREFLDDEPERRRPN